MRHHPPFFAKTFIRVMTIFHISDKQAKSHSSRTHLLALPGSQGAGKSRIPLMYFSFSRIPHRISVKSRIPKIPFQTLRQLKWLQVLKFLLLFHIVFVSAFFNYNSICGFKALKTGEDRLNSRELKVIHSLSYPSLPNSKLSCCIRKQKKQSVSRHYRYKMTRRRTFSEQKKEKTSLLLQLS